MGVSAPLLLFLLGLALPRPGVFVNSLRLGGQLSEPIVKVSGFETPCTKRVRCTCTRAWCQPHGGRRWARVLGVGHACALRGCDHERIDRPSASPGALCVGVTMSALTGASVRVEAPGVPQ